MPPAEETNATSPTVAAEVETDVGTAEPAAGATASTPDAVPANSEAADDQDEDNAGEEEEAEEAGESGATPSV
jgi:hypothetical protein